MQVRIIDADHSFSSSLNVTIAPSYSVDETEGDCCSHDRVAQRLHRSGRGAYDGDLGVVGAIAGSQEALREEGFKPQKSIEAVMFTTEEASRFNVPCVGR